METDVDGFKEILNNKSYSNLLEQKIRYFSSFISKKSTKNSLFNKFRYNKDIFKLFSKHKLSDYFIILLNKIIERKKNINNNNKDILFISIIISKLYNEKIISKDELLNLSQFFIDSKKYEPFLEILKMTQLEEIFIQLKSHKLNNLDRIILKRILSQNSQYIKSILSLDSNKYEPYKYISNLFQLEFNLNLFNIEVLLVNEFKCSSGDNVFPKNYIINIFKTLIDLIEVEENLLKNNIIYGLYTINGFNYNNKIVLEEKFSININMKIYTNQKETMNEFIIFKLYQEKNNDLIKLYFDTKYNIKLKYFSKDFNLINGKNLDLNHMHSLKIYFNKESGWLNGYTQKIKVNLNGQEHNFDSSTLIDGEECNLFIGEFNGELTEFSITSGKKDLFKINFLGLYNLYKNSDLFGKEFDLDIKGSKLIEAEEVYIKKNITKLNKDSKKKNKNDKEKEKEELNCTNYFFKKKKTIMTLLDENGLEYIISLMINLIKELINNNNDNNNNIEDIYQIIFSFWDLFLKIFNILSDKLNDNDKKNTYFQKLMTVLYSYSILQNYLSEKLKMPDSLITKIVDFLKFLSENKKDNSPIVKSFYNHILMIVLTQQNTYNIPIDKITSFLQNLISSKEPNYYLDCYISILIDLFFVKKETKEIKQLLYMFINNFSDIYLIRYIIIFQQFSINDENKSEKNYEISYKLLKLIYKSKICEKTNIIDKADTELILYNFQKILQLDDDNNNSLKENEEKNLEIDVLSDFEESDEFVPTYLTKLKSISIRIIDNFIIKKYRILGRKTMLVKDERYNKVKNSIAILFSINNLDLYTMRSFLLISFDTPNEQGLRFIKHGFGHDGVNISELKMIESFTSIKFMFSIFDIIKNKIHKKDFFEFIKLLMDETMKKIRIFANSNQLNVISYKNNYSMNIFEYKKIGILLNNIIIELKSIPENTELKFNDNYLITVIENILFLHPNPFFFNLCLELTKDYIKNENTYEYNYIVKMMDTFVKLLNYESIEKNKKFKDNTYLSQNFHLNSVKYISLVNDIIHSYLDEDNIKDNKLINNTIYEKEENENENLLDFIFSNFFLYLKNNINNPLLYSSIIANKDKNQIILEIIFDICHLYKLYDSKEEQKTIEILNLIIYPEIIKKNKKKQFNTILCYIDLYKEINTNKASENKNVPIINKIYDLEQKLLKTREINTINYFFTLKILRQILVNISRYDRINQNKKKQENEKNKNNEEQNNNYYKFLIQLKNDLISELNLFYLKDITKKYRIKTLDIDYNKFRVKVENCLLKKENLENMLLRYISETAEQIIESDSDNLSIYSYKNIEIEGDDKSVISTNSSISIKPKEKFKFQNSEIIHEKSIKYDTIYNKININNIKFWIKEIGIDGLLLIFKNNRSINRGIFSAFIDKDDLYDNTFINKIIPEFHNYTHYKNKSEKSNNILYPTSLKNYTTSIYTKPFLKSYKNLYFSSSFDISHKYFIHLKPKVNLITKNIPLIFDEVREIQCELITIKGNIYCNLYIKENMIIIKNNNIKITNPKDLHLFSSNKYTHLDKLIIIPFNYIKEIITRRFLYMNQACEIFTIDNKSYLINFFDRIILLENFYTEVKRMYPNIHSKIIDNVREYFDYKNFVDDWNNNKINNFEFINMLNKYSSRSYNDLQQYPVFPWIFTKYPEIFFENKKYNLISFLQKNNANINIINKKLYNQYLRLFQYPISAQTGEKREELEKNFDKNFFKFKSHFNSHYSTISIILYFLVRMSPFTEEHIKFQGGQFDKIERMYFGPESYLKISELSNDNREPTPEMFYFFEMYYNMNYNYFGYSNNKKMYLNNIIIPNKKISPFEFIYLNRVILNSSLISETINLWINNIFGVKQLEFADKDKMRSSCNIYPWQSYEKIFRKYYEQYKLNKDIKVNKSIIFKTPKKMIYNMNQMEFDMDEGDFPIDNNNIKEQLNTINLFGQCPVEVLKKYLSQKGKNIGKSNSLLKKEKDNQQIEEKKFNGKNKIIDESKILYISYDCNSDYIIYINDNKILYVLKKDDFSEKYKFTIIGNFIPLTSSIVITYNNCQTIIISNIMEEKIILAEKGKLKYQHKILDIPTCLCKIDDDYFYIGTMNGFIQKIKITFQKSKENLNEIQNIKDEKYILGHKYRLVREIIYSSSLNVLISLGDDNRIFIRNEAYYELLTVIDLSLYLNESILKFRNNTLKDSYIELDYGNRIILNKYDTIYYINEYFGCIIAFTLNGYKIFKKNIINNISIENKKYIFSSYLINIYEDIRLLSCDSTEKKIIEYNPTNLNETFFIYDLANNIIKIDDNKNNIKAFFYNEKNKCFDIWIKKDNIFEIRKFELNNQFNYINQKENIIQKDNDIKINNQKQQKEKLSENILKTSISFSSKKNNNKPKIP